MCGMNDLRIVNKRHKQYLLTHKSTGPNVSWITLLNFTGQLVMRNASGSKLSGKTTKKIPSN
jgi:hypothetical protein